MTRPVVGGALAPFGKAGLACSTPGPPPAPHPHPPTPHPPQGVADGVSQVTCWPSALTVVMSWNTTAMQAYGAAMGAEQYIKGTNVMLGPAVNLARVPWGGRTFEYTGGEDAPAWRRCWRGTLLKTRAVRIHAPTSPRA